MVGLGFVVASVITVLTISLIGVYSLKYVQNASDFAVGGVHGIANIKIG